LFGGTGFEKVRSEREGPALISHTRSDGKFVIKPSHSALEVILIEQDVLVSQN
jgi:hypothetical protein